MATPPRPNFNLDNIVAPDVGGSLIDFANMQSKQFQLGLSNVMAEAQARRANEQAEREKINFDRLESERHASDLFNQELLKGKQIHGGILNTDELISESNKYAFTPEEIVKYETYKGDEAAARKAGDIALADKMAWQTRVSDFANSGSDKLKESRVQLLERVLGNVSSKGLPIPAELVAGMEQARLSEETVNKEARKDIDEKISKLTESLNKDQKWAIGSLGASQYTDEDGVTHNTGGSTGSSSSEVRANNTNVGQGNKLLMTAIDGLKLSDKDAKLDATAKALELTSILKEQGIPFDDAAAMVANGLYSKEQNPVLSWIGLGKKGAAINQEAIDLFAANALKQYQQTSSGTGGTGGKSGISDKASAAIDYFQNQRDSVSTQLAKLYKEKALLEGTAEERQTASLNRLLQSKGILETPEELLSKELASKAQFNAKDLKDSEKLYNTGQGYSDPKTLANKIAKIETGGIKGDTYSAVHPSGALGRYGFVPSTAVEEMQKAGYKGTKEELLSQFISTPSIQDKLMNNYMNFNVSILEKRGVPITDWTIWTAHNLGAGNAIKLSKGIVDDEVISAISKNLPAGVKPSVENYQKQWYSKINVGDETKKYIKEVESNTSNSSIIKDLFSKVDGVKELVGKSNVISEYKNKRDEQEKELSSSVYARTFGPKAEAGKYARIWEESDSKKGSTLNKNISSLAAALRKDGIKTYEDVAALYQIMPKGLDRDAVGEVLNYKGTQNSQEWRDAKAPGVGIFDTLAEGLSNLRTKYVTDDSSTLLKLITGKDLTTQKEKIEQNRIRAIKALDPYASKTGPITQEEFYSILEDKNMKEAKRTYIMNQMAKDPAWIYSNLPNDPKIPEEVKDRFRAIQAYIRQNRQ